MARLPDDEVSVKFLAKGRNIEGLTEEQVGVSQGWRLTTDEEAGNMPTDAEIWITHKEFWDTRYSWNVGEPADPGTTYRTKAPLPRKTYERTFNGLAIRGEFESQEAFDAAVNQFLVEPFKRDE